MLYLVVLGVAAGLFFSATFVLNEVMSLEGGSWVWSAALRYVYMVIFLSVIIVVQGGVSRLSALLCLFKSYWRFWVVCGGIGFGFFYALLCFSADYSPGWVVAATWQFTLVASLIVMLFFRRTFPARVWLFCAIIFSGVTLVNLSYAMTDVQAFDGSVFLRGALPVLLASFCYPFGNQLLWEARSGQHRHIPHIKSPLLDNAFHKVFLLSLGSFPLWGVLLLLQQPGWPAAPQLFNTALVALLSGVCATTLFLLARSRASSGAQLAAVDATQASEVVFALLGSLIWLDGDFPSSWGLLGLGCIGLGLGLFLRVRTL